jgi:hypothetical protein
MQCNVRRNLDNDGTMDKVKDVVVERDGPMSPYSKRPIFSDDREWDSVLDFVHCGRGSLERGALLYFCQNIHLQRPLRDPDVKFHFQGFDKEERKDIMACYAFLREQFVPFANSEAFDAAFGFANVHERGFRDDASRFFDMCQPFFGKDRALVLAHAWFNKRLYKSEYDETIERLLQSFPAIE